MDLKEWLFFFKQAAHKRQAVKNKDPVWDIFSKEFQIDHESLNVLFVSQVKKAPV